MFGKEQPDVVTEEEVGEFIEQLKKDGILELDYTELEQRVPAAQEEKKFLKGAGYALMYGSSPAKICKELNIEGTVTGRIKGGSINELVRPSENSTSGTQVKK